MKVFVVRSFQFMFFGGRLDSFKIVRNFYHTERYTVKRVSFPILRFTVWDVVPRYYNIVAAIKPERCQLSSIMMQGKTSFVAKVPLWRKVCSQNRCYFWIVLNLPNIRFEYTSELLVSNYITLDFRFRFQFKFKFIGYWTVAFVLI